MADNDAWLTSPPSGVRPGDPDRGHVAEGVVLNHTWRVGPLIARGGMGEVYRGENLHTGDPVAIKVLLPSLAADPATQRLLLSEARKMSRIRHPAVVHYVTMSAEPEHRLTYLVMDFIEGESLGALIGRLRPDDSQVISLMRRLAEGLAAAHQAGVFHRDLSPDNILVPAGRLDEAIVIDFGIARDTDPNTSTIVGDGFAGKIGWVAPEQFGEFDGHIGPWTDIYSLGLTLLAFASGRPVDMGVTLAVAVEKRKSIPDLSGAPTALRSLFANMLAPDPAQRFPSMEALLARLQQLASGADDATQIRPRQGGQAAAAMFERPAPTPAEETHRLAARAPVPAAATPSPRSRPSRAVLLVGGFVGFLVVVAAGLWVALPHTLRQPSASPPTQVAATPVNPATAPAPALPAATAAVSPTTQPDPAAGLIGRWAIEGIGCASPVTFTEAAGDITRNFAGSSVHVRPASAAMSSELGQTFRAADGAVYVLKDGALSMTPAGGGQAMKMTLCAR